MNSVFIQKPSLSKKGGRMGAVKPVCFQSEDKGACIVMQANKEFLNWVLERIYKEGGLETREMSSTV